MIRIYGASDDLVEIEGDVKDEVDALDRDVQFVIMQTDGHKIRGRAKHIPNATPGLRVWMHYTDLGVWAAAILPVEDGVPLPWPVRVSVKGYTTVVEIDCPPGTSVQWQRVDPGSW